MSRHGGAFLILPFHLAAKSAETYHSERRVNACEPCDYLAAPDLQRLGIHLLSHFNQIRVYQLRSLSDRKWLSRKTWSFYFFARSQWRSIEGETCTAVGETETGGFSMTGKCYSSLGVNDRAGIATHGFTTRLYPGFSFLSYHRSARFNTGPTTCPFLPSSPCRDARTIHRTLFCSIPRLGVAP
jgi:hypothetical protein